VSVNYHAINNFRAGNATLMDELLPDNVATLAAAGAISLERVAPDGTRVPTEAGGFVSSVCQPSGKSERGRR